MQAIRATRQKCRPKHQILVLKCYPRTTKGAVDVKPNSSELSYLLYYATTRRSKVQKVGAFLEKKTAGDVWRARIGNVQVTLQILTALIEKAPRDLPLYAEYILKILAIILRSNDITMVESSTALFDAFCVHHDGASLSADQEYLRQYEEVVRIYASFASTRAPTSKVPISAPVAMRWRSAGLEAIKSVASSEALASPAGRQVHVIVPILLENLWTDNGDFLDLLQHKADLEEKVKSETLLRRRTSNATVKTTETADNPLALSQTTADADKLAEEDIGVNAIQCLKHIFLANNRVQIFGATQATLQFIADRIAQEERVLADTNSPHSAEWATRIFEMIARWTPVQDRYVILVTTMEVLVRGALADDNLQQQLILATMVDSLLKSDINLIGLSVMDVLLGLIQHILRLLQLDGAAPHPPQANGAGKSIDGAEVSLSTNTETGQAEAATVPTSIRIALLAQLQNCIGSLATHVYYADQISDMVSAILARLKPPPLSGVPNTAAAIEDPIAASAAVTAVGDLTEDPNTDGFFSFDTAKVNALLAVKAILLVASHRKHMAGGSLARNRVPVRIWEGTQWLLRDSAGNVRKAYADALLTWLDREVTRSDLRIFEDKGRTKGLTRTTRDDSTTNLTKRAVSNASQKDKAHKHGRTAFLELFHLAVYENALQYVESEADIVLLHLLLTSLIQKLGVNAVKNGLPMVFRLQEDILEAETPVAKIRLGSLCHGYFRAVSEKFDFESSPVGQAIGTEINRRRKKQFWVDRITQPPISLANIGNPGSTTSHQSLPREELETESLLPFDDRFQMVKLISLSYAESHMVPPSAPTSPGRGPAQPILTATAANLGENHTMPEAIKEEMMAEWTRESAIAIAREGSKSGSLNGSRSGTNTGGRNFLAVNGNLNTGGTNSGTASPHGHQHSHKAHSQKSKANSTYGLVGGLGAIQKIRKQSGNSPSPPSESSRGSVTRVDALKRILSGQQPGRPTTGAGGVAHSDASSDSMVSYNDDFTASDVSFNPDHQQNVPPMERSASLREPRSRSRSKSQDRASPDGRARPLTSHPVLTTPEAPGANGVEGVPPVPPIPAGVGITPLRKSRSVKRAGTTKRIEPAASIFGEDEPVVDLESLLKGIDNGEGKDSVVKPPY